MYFSELTSVDADINFKWEKWKWHWVHNVNDQFAGKIYMLKVKHVQKWLGFQLLGEIKLI